MHLPLLLRASRFQPLAHMLPSPHTYAVPDESVVPKLPTLILGWSEGRIFYVAVSKDCDIILGSPALRYTKADINMVTNSVNIQPTGLQRFTLQPRIYKLALKLLGQKRSSSYVLQCDHLGPHLPKLTKYHTVEFLSVSTTRRVPHTSFDEYLEVCTAENIVQLSLLIPHTKHTLNLQNSNLVV